MTDDDERRPPSSDTHKPPYGWRVGAGGLLERNPAEQAVIKAIRDLHRAGLSLAGIAAMLEEKGLLPKGTAHAKA